MDSETTLNYGYLIKLTEFGITRYEFGCNICSIGKVYLQSGKKRHGYNKYPRCGNLKCRKWHNPFLSSLFYGTKLSYKNIYHIIEEFCNISSVSQSSSHHGINRRTFNKYHTKFRELILLQIPNMKLPSNSIYEIDETHLYTRKYNRGRRIQGEQYWVVGIYCRNTKKIRLEIVQRRTSEILEDFVTNNINLNNNTTIISDGWRGYLFLNNYSVKYNFINHSVSFVDPYDRDIHTNGIERVWRSLKEYIPDTLTVDKKLVYMKIFQYFYNRGAKRFRERFLVLVDLLKQICINEISLFYYNL